MYVRKANNPGCRSFFSRLMKKLPTYTASNEHYRSEKNHAAIFNSASSKQPKPGRNEMFNKSHLRQYECYNETDFHNFKFRIF